MSNLGTHPTFDATSAAGAMLGRQVRGPAVLLFILSSSIGTSAGYALPTNTALQLPVAYRTTAGGLISVAVPAGTAIGELRRLSGLTWDQLARLFNVSRRSLHFWASGGEPSIKNGFRDSDQATQAKNARDHAQVDLSPDMPVRSLREEGDVRHGVRTSVNWRASDARCLGPR